MSSFSTKNELNAFVRAVKNSKFKGITWAQVFTELLINGISAIIALFVSSLLGKFFAVRNLRNLWGLAARKKSKILIDKDTYEWLNIIIIFVIGLFVFSIVEEILSKYLEERKKDVDSLE
jgi:hypothetical protein